MIYPCRQQLCHSSGIIPQIQRRQGCVCMCAVEQVLCVSIFQRGQNDEVCLLVSILCKYHLRKGDLFVLSWARLRRVCLASVSSVVFIGGGYSI